MTTLIKVIIFLFLTALMLLYILVPSLHFSKGTAELWPYNLPWYAAMYIISHTFVGAAILLVPLIFIFKWIDENIKKPSWKD